MRYLLDTNILSNLMRNPEGRVAARIDEVGHYNVCTSIIVAAELRFGAAKKRSASLTELLNGALLRIEVLPFASPSDIVYGEIRAEVERRGRPVGGYDLLIAAQAISLGLTLVTGNERELKSVRGLRVENWLRD